MTDLADDWWTPLVLRELGFGQARFDEIRARLGCSTSVLTQRLNRLVDEGRSCSTPPPTTSPRSNRLADVVS